MFIFGKVFGAIFGFLLFGGNIFGLLLGTYLGHLFDKGLKSNVEGMKHRFNRSGMTQRQFFSTTFLFMGYIAKLDGRVSEREIHVARSVMARLSLDHEQKQEAIQFFTQGKEQAFDFESTLSEFAHQCGAQPQLAELFLELQVQAALADGKLVGIKRQVLCTLCEALGMPMAVLYSLEAQFQGQHRYSSQHSNQRRRYYTQSTQVDEVALAYKTLNVSKHDSDTDVKKAYRKLVSQNHPDKLVSKGLPPEMIKLATEKTQKIHKAYEIIQKHRGIK